LNESYDINKLTDHLFRRESGKIVSVLTRVFGTENLETSEDVVQQTFFEAIHIWRMKGVPANPSAWLFRVAKNKAIDIIRRNKFRVGFDTQANDKQAVGAGNEVDDTINGLLKEEFIIDDLLRMMFTCCHPGIAKVNQVTLILKTLCGFSTAEIARGLLTSEDTVSKRLYRTKEFFRQQKISFTIPSVEVLKYRTNAVLNSVYLLFNEGYNSTHADNLIRNDLIEEAMMLCRLLTENRYTQLPETYALMALMYFHAARNESRQTAEGTIILLPDQDRSRWNLDYITLGNQYMNDASFGNEVTSYHLEAAIAFEHCTAESFAATNWERIAELYEWLVKISSSPVVELNRAVAILQTKGPEAALDAIDGINDKNKLKTFYLYHSLLGEIHSRMNDPVKAAACFETALFITQAPQEKRLLQNKIERMGRLIR